jgi:isopenicillin N synthase-like dioxygenase
VSLAVHPVDLEPFRLGGPEERRAVAVAIDEACRDTGFLVLTGHGVPLGLCDQILDAYGAFFDLPAAEKQRLTVHDPAANRGYTAVGQEALAYTLGDATPPDLFEALTVGREDAIGPAFDARRASFHPNLWPDRPVGLRDVFLAYESAMRDVASTVLAAMSIALGLDEGWLGERCRDAIITTRALNYERSPGSPPPEPRQMRLGAHTDYGVVTLLLADPLPGLQVRREGSWHDVIAPRGSFIGNIGDLLAMWTNDRWRSTIHRVVPPPAVADGPFRRRSIARFLDGEPGRVIECIPSCATADRPAKYPPVIAGDWLHAKIVGGRTRTVPTVGVTT